MLNIIIGQIDFQTLSLNVCRRYLSSAVLTLPNESDVLVAAGGGKGPFDCLNKVEAFDGSEWNDEGYNDLPQELCSSCLIKINSSTLLATGGGVS